jgi:pilus assembly protein CpaE
MQANNIKVKLELKNPKVSKSFENIINTLDGYSLQRSKEKTPCDLMIFELGKNDDKDFQVVGSILDLNTAGDVFLTSRDSSKSVLRQAIKIGAKDFFSQPINADDVIQSLESYRGFRERAGGKIISEKKGKIINILGSKGGVGATTLAVNLATNLAEYQGVQSVALVDLNTSFGEIPFFLEFKPNYHWGEITDNIARVDPTFLMEILHKHASGVYVLPSPNCLNGCEPPTPDIMERLLLLLRGMFEYIVIDGGHTLDSSSLRIIEMSDILLLVSILNIPCLSNTNHLVKSFARLNYLPDEHVRIVINRYLRNSEISLRDAEKGIDKEIYWTVPNDYKTTMSALNQGKSLSEIASRASITKNLRRLVDNLVATDEKKEKKRLRLVKRR